MKLSDFLIKNNITMSQAAKELGLSYENIRRYYNEIVVPRPTHMQKIVYWSGGSVRPNDFYDIPELSNSNDNGDGSDSPDTPSAA